MKTLNLLILFTFIIISTNNTFANPQTKDFENVNKLMNRLTEEGFSGAVLVAQNGKVSSNTYGFADRENKIKNTTNTVFSTGSVTKPFTAAAILKLEMMGKLSVQDKLSKYFDNLPDDKKNITLHQLLTHSSGFPDSVGRDYEIIEKEAFLKRSFSSKLLFEPGTEYEYSNVGFSILAAIIEKTSGEDYEKFLYKNLFLPAGMKDTGYSIPKWKVEQLAVGYLGDDRWGKMTEKSNRKPEMYWNLLGNGGILTTVEDLYKWHLALESDKILSKEAKEKHYKPYIEEGEGSDTFYGYGWSIVPTSNNSTLITHNGGNGVFFCDFWRFPKEKTVIIVMTNSLKPIYRSLANEISKILFDPNYESKFTNRSEKITNLAENPNGKLIQTFLDSVKSQDAEKIKSLVNDNFSPKLQKAVPIENFVKGLSNLGGDLKDLKLDTASVQGDKIILTFADSPFRVSITVEDGKIGGIDVEN
jgi:CubicO group peptidase (beta-lactamase class C family)